jgi:two-component system cell cycle response regulator
MNLDTSQRYFALENECLVMRLPENCSPSVLAEVTTFLKPKCAAAVDAGQNKAVIDIHLVKSLHMGVIKLLMQAMQVCRELGIQFAMVGNTEIIAECKGFEDTRSWSFYDTTEDAKGSLTRSNVPAAQPQLAAV